MRLNKINKKAETGSDLAGWVIIEDYPMKNSSVLPENTDSDLAISTESPRGGEQLDELIKDISIFE